MIDKEIPSEYMSIRQIWLQRIDDCGHAISQRAIQEPNYDRSALNIGDRTIVYTVESLYYSLVDYGEALIRSDVDRYKEKSFTPNIEKIWESWENNQTEDKEDGIQFAGYPEAQKKRRLIGECWHDHARESMDLFDFIIQTLNKYGMLFEKQPEGFSNVEMRSVE